MWPSEPEEGVGVAVGTGEGAWVWPLVPERAWVCPSEPGTGLAWPWVWRQA